MPNAECPKWVNDEGRTDVSTRRKPPIVIDGCRIEQYAIRPHIITRRDRRRGARTDDVEP